MITLINSNYEGTPTKNLKQGMEYINRVPHGIEEGQGFTKVTSLQLFGLQIWTTFKDRNPTQNLISMAKTYLEQGLKTEVSEVISHLWVPVPGR